MTRTRGHCWDRSCWNACWLSAFWPWSPAGASRRRRARWPLPCRRRSRFISIARRAMFQVLISPGKVGSDDFVLQLMAGDASPLPAREATLTLSLPERGIEPLRAPRDVGAGRLLARARRAAAAARPLAHADRCAGERFREDHAGRRFRRALRRRTHRLIASIIPAISRAKAAGNPHDQRLFAPPGLVFLHPIRFHCTSSRVPLIP